MSLDAPIYRFYPAVVVFDSKSYTRDSIILLSGLECKVLFVAWACLCHTIGENHLRPERRRA
jgi:hypothetical protein